MSTLQVPFSTLRQPACLYGPDGRIAAANDRAETLAGRPLAGRSIAEAIGIFDIRSSDGAPLVEAAMPVTGALLGEEAVDVPLAVTTADGRTVRVLATASPIREGDAVAGALVVWQEVVDGETADGAGRGRYRRLLDAILGALPYTVSLWGRNERIVWANERFAAERGEDREALIGRSWRDLGAPLDIVEPLVREALEAVLTGATITRDVAVAGTNGGTWRACTFLPFGRDAILVITGDVTERKRIEEEMARYADDLRESRQQLADVIEATGAGYYDMATDASEGTISRRGAELLGVLPDEVPRFPEFGPWALRRVHPDDLAALTDSFAAFIAGETERNEAEFRVLNRDGGYRWVRAISTSVQQDEDGRVAKLAGFLFDIDEQQRAEAVLVQSNEELQRFAYVASHDLQEPLRSIISFSQLLQRRCGGKLDADADEFIGFIVEGGNRMQALIQDLLQVSRLETQARPPEPTDAAAVVYVALRALETPIRAAGACVTVEELPAVMADWTQLEQVFANLVGNAIKYRREGVQPRIRISAERRDGMVEFAVTDNGIGIEAEYFEQIFEMFRRLHTHDEYEGTGIGLAVVRRIVERHGGRVRVASSPGEGSTFFFTLPAA